MINKHVNSFKNLYKFQSPPAPNRRNILKKQHRQVNSNNSFNAVSTDTFYFPCNRTRLRRYAEPKLEQMLEEITDRKTVTHYLPTDVEETQLSPYFPKFVNRVKTRDAATQTQTCDIGTVNYVYDFYIEVIPILERLVGHTIEQAMTELVSDEEKLMRQAHNARVNVVVAADRVEVNRRREETFLRDDEIRRRYEEENRRLEQTAKAYALEAFKKLASEMVDKWRTNGIRRLGLKQVEEETEKREALYMKVECDLKKYFVPEILTRALGHPVIHLETQARACLDGMIRDAVDERR